LYSKGFPVLIPVEIPWHFRTIAPTKAALHRRVPLNKIGWLGSYIGGRLKGRLTRGEKTMQGFKSVVVIATIVAAAISLGACRKELEERPLKLGASDVVVAVR
jgi:hypothetical protein